MWPVDAGLTLFWVVTQVNAFNFTDVCDGLVAGLSISAPADRLEEAWLERLKDTAAQISSALGHRPTPAAAPAKPLRAESARA